MITQEIYDWCHSPKTVGSEIAANPNTTPAHAAHKLYGKHKEAALLSHSAKDRNKSGYDLERAYHCGSWGDTRPSQLFLKASYSLLLAGARNPF